MDALCSFSESSAFRRGPQDVFGAKGEMMEFEHQDMMVINGKEMNGVYIYNIYIHIMYVYNMIL